VNKQMTTQSRLFDIQHRNFQLPSMNTSYIEDAYDQMELLGFPLLSYFDLLNDTLLPHIMAKNMSHHMNQSVLLYGVLVNTRHHKTSTGKLMRFCTFVDREGHYFDTVH